MAYIPPTLGGAVTMTKCNSTLSSLAPGQVQSFNYANLKTWGDESVNTDGFWLVDDAYLSNVLVSVDGGTTKIPIATRAAALGFDTSALFINIMGVFPEQTTNTYLGSSMYVQIPSDATMGANILFNVRAMEYINGVWGDGDIASVNVVPVKFNIRSPANTLFTGGSF